MSTGRTIARNSLLLGLAHGASKFFSIALTAVAGRVLGTAGFGIYATGAALVEVGRVVASSGLDYLVAREVASDPSQSSRVASNASAVKLLLGAVAYTLLLVAVVLLDYPPMVLAVVLILGTALFLENLSDIVDAVFQGHERMGFTTRTFTVTSAFLFVSASAALLGGLGLIGYVSCFALSFLLRLLLLIRFARRHDVARVSSSYVERTEIVRMIRMAMPLFGATVLSLLFHRMDLLMLGKLVSEDQVGLYAAAVRIIDVTVLLPRILATAVYPALRRQREHDPEEMRRVIGEATRISLLVCSVAGLAVWLVAPFALRVTPGPEFVPATFVLRTLSWGVVLQGAAHLCVRMLLVVDAERDMLKIAGLAMTTNLVLNLWWIPRLGIEGAAYATLTSYVVAVSLYFLFLRRRGVVVPMRASALPPLLAVAVAAGASTFDAVHTELRYGGILLVWLVPLILLRAIHPGDVRAVRSMLRRKGRAGEVDGAEED